MARRWSLIFLLSLGVCALTHAYKEPKSFDYEKEHGIIPTKRKCGNCGRELSVTPDGRASCCHKLSWPDPKSKRQVRCDLHASSFQGVVDKLSHCPGRYCGRTKLENGSWSACGACERGLRRNNLSECEECHDEPKFYDVLYLGFMGLLPLTFHLGCIDAAAKRRTFTYEVIALYGSAILEVGVAAVVTLLVTEPIGSFHIRSCKVRKLADWYPLLHNPNPNYEGKLHCTQEAVYPLYSMVFVFYTLCLLVMLIIRPVLSSKLMPNRGKSAIYSALYFLPALIVVHAIAAGLIYYSFPYMVIIMSVISNAAHFAFQLDQSMPGLLKGCVKDVRNLVILLGHWGLHAYGIIAITQLKEGVLHGSLCALVPLPALFYILTSRFTDPSNIG